MSRHKILGLSPIFLILVAASLLPSTFAQAPGPEVPTGNNTVTQYCLKGICSTGAQTFTFNATIGLNPVGQYPNGIPQNLSVLIGIQDIKACLIMFEHNITSHCIPYNKLKVFDNTNPLYAGQWVSFPYYHREPPRVLNHYNFNPNPFIQMVDPDPDFTARARMVYVTNDNFTWINPDENGTNYTLKAHVNRAVLNCETATVAPIMSLIADTIKYMESGCTKTSYNDTIIMHQTPSPFYLDTNNMKQVNYASHFNNVTRLGNCITQKCGDLPADPFHSHDKKFGW